MTADDCAPCAEPPGPPCAPGPGVPPDRQEVVWEPQRILLWPEARPDCYPQASATVGPWVREDDGSMCRYSLRWPYGCAARMSHGMWFVQDLRAYGTREEADYVLQALGEVLP